MNSTGEIFFRLIRNEILKYPFENTMNSPGEYFSRLIQNIIHVLPFKNTKYDELNRRIFF